LLALIVQQLLLIYVGFCCDGLWAFIPVSLQLRLLSTAIDVFIVVISYFTTTRSKKVAKQLVGSACRERDKSLREQANDAATGVHCHVVMAPI